MSSVERPKKLRRPTVRKGSIDDVDPATLRVIRDLATHSKLALSGVGRPHNKISGISAQLVWQYVRRNENYCSHYKSLGKLYDESEDQAEDFESSLREYWCLPCGLVDPRKVRFPKKDYFERPSISIVPNPAQELNNLNPKYRSAMTQIKMERLNLKLRPRFAVPKDFFFQAAPMLLYVPPSPFAFDLVAQFKGLAKGYAKKIAKASGASGPDFDSIEKLLSRKGLVEGISFKLYEEIAIPIGAAQEFHKSTFDIKLSLQHSQLKARAKTFQRRSDLAPWIFFLLPSQT
jgi:hypothetical protein